MLRLKQVATRAQHALYRQIADLAWAVYHATTKRSFAQRLRRLREWGHTLAEPPLHGQLLKVCGKKAGFLPAYDHPTSLRTSNMIDRVMHGMDTDLLATSSFHGTLVSAQRGIRASCLLTNFRPMAYNPPAHVEYRDIHTPLAHVTGFVYHENWLHHLLIATSRQEIYQFQQKKLE